MKMQFVFGNPNKKSSFPKKGNALKSKGKVKGLLEKLKAAKKKPVKKRDYSRFKGANGKYGPASNMTLKQFKAWEKSKDAIDKGFGDAMAKKAKKAKKISTSKKLKSENKKLKKAVQDLEQMEMELLDSSIKGKKMAKKKKGSKKSPSKKKVAKKVAPKRRRKKASKKVAKKVKKKVAKKVAPKKAAPKRRRRKSAKKVQVKKAAPIRRRRRKAARKGKVYKYNKGYHLTYKKIKRSRKGKPHYRKNKKGTVKYMWKRNPLGGSMSKLEKFTGMSMPEAGGLLVGGLAYGAVNSILSKIPVVKVVHGQLLKVPVVGSALPTLMAGALLNFLGDKYKVKAASMLGKGLVGAAVVGMGVNASQMVPGLKGMSGVDFTMGDYSQLGLNEADFGEDNPADFGELIDYNSESFSGVDYTMNGVDFTMGEDNPADFGELIDMNSEALSGGQLG
jgi:hypothetical protein